MEDGRQREEVLKRHRHRDRQEVRKTGMGKGRCEVRKRKEKIDKIEEKNGERDRKEVREE